MLVRVGCVGVWVMGLALMGGVGGGEGWIGRVGRGVGAHHALQVVLQAIGVVRA